MTRISSFGVPDPEVFKVEGNPMVVKIDGKIVAPFIKHSETAIGAYVARTSYKISEGQIKQFDLVHAHGVVGTIVDGTLDFNVEKAIIKEEDMIIRALATEDGIFHEGSDFEIDSESRVTEVPSGVIVQGYLKSSDKDEWPTFVVEELIIQRTTT